MTLHKFSTAFAYWNSKNIQGTSNSLRLSTWFSASCEAGKLELPYGALFYPLRELQFRIRSRAFLSSVKVRAGCLLVLTGGVVSKTGKHRGVRRYRRRYLGLRNWRLQDRQSRIPSGGVGGRGGGVCLVLQRNRGTLLAPTGPHPYIRHCDGTALCYGHAQYNTTFESSTS